MSYTLLVGNVLFENGFLTVGISNDALNINNSLLMSSF